MVIKIKYLICNKWITETSNRQWCVVCQQRLSGQWEGAIGCGASGSNSKCGSPTVTAGGRSGASTVLPSDSDCHWLSHPKVQQKGNHTKFKTQPCHWDYAVLAGPRRGMPFVRPTARSYIAPLIDNVVVVVSLNRFYHPESQAAPTSGTSGEFVLIILVSWIERWQVSNEVEGKSFDSQLRLLVPIDF